MSKEHEATLDAHNQESGTPLYKEHEATLNAHNQESGRPLYKEHEATLNAHNQESGTPNGTQTAEYKRYEEKHPTSSKLMITIRALVKTI
jgi:hypothetical protein